MLRKSLMLLPGESCAGVTGEAPQAKRDDDGRLSQLSIPRGAPLRVTSGPFVGICGAFQSAAAKRGHVVLLINVLGKRVALAIQREQVELA